MYTGAHLNVGTVQHEWAYSYRYILYNINSVLVDMAYIVVYTHKHNIIMWQFPVHLLFSIGTQAVGVGASLHQRQAVFLHETLILWLFTLYIWEHNYLGT